MCDECVMCGFIPLHELAHGDKWTRRCLLPGHERNISGRGSHTPTARNRCTEHEYQKYCLMNEFEVELSETLCERYQISQPIVFPPHLGEVVENKVQYARNDQISKTRKRKKKDDQESSS